MKRGGSWDFTPKYLVYDIFCFIYFCSFLPIHSLNCHKIFTSNIKIKNVIYYSSSLPGKGHTDCA